MRSRWIILVIGILAIAAVATTLVLEKPIENSEVSDHTTDASSLAGLEITTVELSSENIRVEFNGRVRAQQRIELFSEVPGKLIRPDQPFEEGRMFRQGEVLVRVEDTEARLKLQATRSAFRNLVSSLMPDLTLDFPESADRFSEYLESIDPHRPLPELPPAEDPQLFAFLSSRVLFSRYYQVRSAENRIDKFEIRAPFDGVLISALADEGYRVSQQTRLGTFIAGDKYEMVTSLPQKKAALLSPGDKLMLQNQSHTREWTGTVDRINRTIEPAAQGINVYIRLSGENLMDGLYLEGSMKTEETVKRARIPRTAVLRTGHVYLIRDDTVTMKPVEVTGLQGRMVQVKGLSEGDRIIVNPDRPLASLRVTSLTGE